MPCELLNVNLLHISQSCKTRVSGLWLKIKLLGGVIKPKNKQIMRHIENARNILEREMDKNGAEMHILNYIKLENTEDIKGIAPVVSFTIQSDPIKEVGVNGCQALDMLAYTRCLFQSLNEAYPCIENEHTIEYLKQAIIWQEVRTRDRISRQVEGENKA